MASTALAFCVARLGRRHAPSPPDVPLPPQPPDVPLPPPPPDVPLPPPPPDVRLPPPHPGVPLPPGLPASTCPPRHTFLAVPVTSTEDRVAQVLFVVLDETVCWPAAACFVRCHPT